MVCTEASTDNYLIAVNLSKSWDWRTNISETALTKQANTRTGISPPVLSRGAIYHGGDSTNNIYLWGGTTSYFNTSFPEFHPPLPSNYSLWSYDIVNKTWDKYDIGSQIQHRPSSGAFTEARDLHLGFFFNGQLDSGSDTQTQALGDDPKLFIDGMVVVDTSKKTARNLSTKAVVGDHPRSRGRMQYLEKIGGDGKKSLLSLFYDYFFLAQIESFESDPGRMKAYFDTIQIAASSKATCETGLVSSRVSCISSIGSKPFNTNQMRRFIRNETLTAILGIIVTVGGNQKFSGNTDNEHVGDLVSIPAQKFFLCHS